MILMYQNKKIVDMASDSKILKKHLFVNVRVVAPHATTLGDP
jgi:hypothetical protein